MRAILVGILILARGISEGSLEEKILQVTGTASVSVNATIAEVHFNVEVEDKKSSLAQKTLSERINHLVEVLKQESPDKLSTSSFSIFPEYSNQTPPEIRSYRGRGEVEITIPIEKAGEAIAHALEAGASGVNQLKLKASDKDLVAAREEALRKALDNALRTAQVAFSQLQLELKEIETIQIASSEPLTVPFRSVAAFAMAKSAGPELEGEQNVQSEVTLKLRFRPKD